MLPGAQDPTFTSEVKVVNLLANVTDKKGAIRRDLTKDDFTVLENGKPQAIRYFSQETGLPLTLGLLVDTSLSQGRVMQQERGASYRFFDRVLRPDKDQVFLAQFDSIVYVRQKLTRSRDDLEKSLAFVDTPTQQELEQGIGGSTRLYDAIIKTTREIMKDQKDRKALILMTDGVDTGSDFTIADAIESAVRTETLVYSILFSDATYYGGPLLGVLGRGMGGPDGRGALQRLSRETGGGFFEVSRKTTLDQVFDAIQEELRSQYSIGFVSDQPVHYSQFRKLQLVTKQKGLVVQTRDRYWAQR